MKQIVNSDRTLSTALAKVREAYKRDKFVVVSITSGKRSLQANALCNLWYEQIGIESDNFPTYAEARAYCKLHFGVPILRRDSDQYRNEYDTLIKPFAYEQKLALMQTMTAFEGGWPVTRGMTRDQMREYMDGIKTHFAKNEMIQLIESE